MKWPTMCKLTALKRALDMNSLSWKDVQNKEPTSYNAFFGNDKARIHQ